MVQAARHPRRTPAAPDARNSEFESGPIAIARGVFGLSFNLQLVPMHMAETRGDPAAAQTLLGVCVDGDAKHTLCLSLLINMYNRRAAYASAVPDAPNPPRPGIPAARRRRSGRCSSHGCQAVDHDAERHRR